MAQALVVQQIGDTPRLELQPIDTHKEPGPRQALVDWHWAGLNRADLLYARGLYFTKPRPGSRMGFEAAGVVRKAGQDSIYSAGQQVAVLPLSLDIAKQGCLASQGIYDDTQLIPCLETLDLKHNAAFWMAYLTAYGGLVEQGDLKSDQCVLVTAASSAVGLACIQIANALHATSIATSTSTSKLAALQDAGATHVLVQPKEAEQFGDFVQQLKSRTHGRGLDLTFDAVAGPCSRALIQASRRGARYIVHGMLDRRPMDVHAGVLMKRLLTLQGYTLEQSLGPRLQREKTLQGLTALARDKRFSPRVDNSYTLDNVIAGLDELSLNQHLGKIVIDCRRIL